MTETLLTPSTIKLFGRTLGDLIFKYTSSTLVAGGNNFLQQQLSGASTTFTGTLANGASLITAVSSTNGLQNGMNLSCAVNGVFANNVIVTVSAIVPGVSVTASVASGQAAPAGSVFTASLQMFFARIYAFSFEGALYSMPKPAIFLVHGGGTQIDAGGAIGGGGGGGGGGRRTSVDESGVVAREWEFSGQKDVSYWEYEKGDFSLRLDTEAGPFEQILLAASLRAGADRADRSGAGVSGAGVSGAGVSGAGVSGAGVSGAGVSGAGLRR